LASPENKKLRNKLKNYSAKRGGLRKRYLKTHQQKNAQSVKNSKLTHFVLKMLLAKRCNLVGVLKQWRRKCLS